MTHPLQALSATCSFIFFFLTLDLDFALIVLFDDPSEARGDAKRGDYEDE
jgi:hypothetical protein